MLGVEVEPECHGIFGSGGRGGGGGGGVTARVHGFLARLKASAVQTFGDLGASGLARGGGGVRRSRVGGFGSFGFRGSGSSGLGSWGGWGGGGFMSCLESGKPFLLSEHHAIQALHFWILPF